MKNRINKLKEELKQLNRKTQEFISNNCLDVIQVDQSGDIAYMDIATDNNGGIALRYDYEGYMDIVNVSWDEDVEEPDWEQISVEEISNEN